MPDTLTPTNALPDPFDEKTDLAHTGCSCGQHASQAEHDSSITESQAPSAEDHLDRLVETAVIKAVFPQDAERRRLIKAVGAGTLAAAINSIFPFGVAKALAQEATGKPEKTDLKIGFIPITCATPIIMAEPMGFYKKHGLNVSVIKTAGWAVVRDKAINKEYDAAHMLSPMPLALSLGAGSDPIPFRMPAVENINGQAITLANKHKDKRDPKQWKGFKFAVPFDYSMHNFLLRYYVAEHGLDPDHDIQIRVVPPPEMVANLRGQCGWLPRTRPLQPAGGVRRRWLHPHADQRHLGWSPLLRVCRQPGVHRSDTQHVHGPFPFDHRRNGLRL